MVIPTTGYLYPFFFCGEDLIDKMDDFTRALFRQQYGGEPNQHLVAFRLSPEFFEVLDLSPRPDWIVYLALGVNDPVPPLYKNDSKLMKYVWGVGSPPSDASVYHKLLETNDPKKSIAAFGTVRSDYSIDWQYLEEREDADSYFWVRIVGNDTRKEAILS